MEEKDYSYKAVCNYGCGYESSLYDDPDEAHLRESSFCDICGEPLDIIAIEDTDL